MDRLMEVSTPGLKPTRNVTRLLGQCISYAT